MLKTYGIFLSIFFLIGCNGVENNNLSSNQKQDLIHIEKGINTKGMTVKVINHQENSYVIQNDAININERGSIKIGN